MERFKIQNKPQIIADNLIVWNQMMHDHLLKIFPNLDPQTIHILGAPRFDYFQHTDKIPSSSELRDHLNLPHNSQLIHFATTELYSLDYVIQAVAAQTPAHLYASVHPGGDINKHQPYAQKHGVTIRYSFGRQTNSPHPAFSYNPTLENIYLLVALFKHSDLLINHSSTVAIESFAGDTPVINVKYGRPLDWWRWYHSMVYRDFQQHYQDIINDGATKIVRNKSELLAAVNNYLKDPAADRAARAQTLKKMITITDGTSSQKILALIKKITTPLSS